tara:strand:+ start:180 stop:1181 length:1002 start_codon:yes stop_codon:yes gene_type:complete
MKSYRDIKLAIIITFYNNAKYIDSIFHSLANQTLLFDEVICIDHGSKNNCKNEVLKASNKYQIKSKFIRMNHNYGGPSWPRNLGVQNSSSDYVCFNDPDDISLINRCEEIKKELYKKKCDILIHSFTTYIEDVRNHNFIKLGRTFINKFNQNKILERLYFDDNILTPVSSYVIKRESILKNTFREEREIIGGEDKVLIIDLLLNNNTIFHFNKVLLLYNYGTFDGRKKIRTSLTNRSNTIKISNYILKNFSDKFNGKISPRSVISIYYANFILKRHKVLFKEIKKYGFIANSVIFIALIKTLLTRGINLIISLIKNDRKDIIKFISDNYDLKI